MLDVVERVFSSGVGVGRASHTGSLSATAATGWSDTSRVARRFGSSRFVAAIAFALAVGCAGAAGASDGVLEINQACALNGSCFPGDFPGFPVAIFDTAGATSVRLSGDLEVPDFSTGIIVFADDVTIDLAGFRIISQSCVGASDASCVPTGSVARGIQTAEARGLTVLDGAIVGLGLTGILAVDSEWTHVQDVDVRWHREDGMILGAGSRVIGGEVSENGRDGISLGPHGYVEATRLVGNGRYGVNAEAGPSIVRATVVRNSGFNGLLVNEAVVQDAVLFGNGSQGTVEDEQVGIRCVGACVLERNSVEASAGNGLQCGSDCVFHANRVEASGQDGLSCSTACVIEENVVVNSAGDGIRAINGSRVRVNAIETVGDDGIVVGTSSAYQDNTITSVVGQPASGTGDDLGGNTCGIALCP